MKTPTSNVHSVSRRDFIKVAGATSIAAFTTAPHVFGDGENQNSVFAQFQNDSVAVLHECDVLIVGGSFAGIAAALLFAQAGKKVILVERRIYLGREITSTYRPWIDIDEKANIEDIPEPLASCIEDDFNYIYPDKILFRPDHVKLALEDKLFDAGVGILYASIPVQLLSNNAHVQGVVFGNKSGRQAILAEVVIDCTETASLCRLADCDFRKPSNEFSTFLRTLEFTQIQNLTADHLNVPASLHIKNNLLHIVKGYFDGSHYYVECPMAFPDPKFDARSTVQRESEAWVRSIKVAQYLYEKVPAFKRAFLTASSYQLQGLYTDQLSPFSSMPLHLDSHGQLQIDGSSAPAQAFATQRSNLWCLNEAARLQPEQTRFLMTPAGACETGFALAGFLLNEWSRLASPSSPETYKAVKDRSRHVKQGVREKFSPQQGRAYDRIKIDNPPIPLLDEVDVLVVGGGSSGATAAYVAAEQGKKTMVIDMNPGFGGTGTFGGVYDYWGHGNYKGFVARHVKTMQEIHKTIPDYIKEYVPYWGKDYFITWNVQAKIYMWLKEIQIAGADILWNSVVIGSIMDESKIVGVVVATPQGTFAVKAKMVIDSTGDGDVAAFAGAPFVLGSSRDNVPLWYALCKFDQPGITGTSFQSTVDATNIQDYTRSVHVGMRTVENRHDHYPYLSPRESRHVLGDVVLTLTDHLTFRQWDDVILVAFSNCDVKGYHASDWIRIGLIPPNLNIEVPYRSIVPKDIENMLVVGRAFSQNHESLATVRMQPDMENLGGVAALAAVEALNQAVQPRHIDLKPLQQQLIDLELIPQDTLNRSIKRNDYPEEELENLIDQFNPDKPLHSYSDMEMNEIWTKRIPFVEVCTSPPENAVPVLERKLQATTGNRRLRIAQALAMLGHESAATVLSEEIHNQLKDDSLPPLTASIKHYTGGGDAAPPGQGGMPLCANLVYAIGMTRSPLTIPVLQRVADAMQVNDPDDFYSKEQALFFYIDAVCYSAGLVGDPACVPALKKIHSIPWLSHQSLKSGVEEDYILERRAMLELILGRAMARCGSTDGLQILIDYLDDMRAILAECAHTTLSRITNQDFGKDKSAWKQWVSTNASEFRPVPLHKRYDG